MRRIDDNNNLKGKDHKGETFLARPPLKKVETSFLVLLKAQGPLGFAEGFSLESL
jgi:hypothetical protein